VENKKVIVERGGLSDETITARKSVTQLYPITDNGQTGDESGRLSNFFGV
jgi:hypothetical protein